MFIKDGGKYRRFINGIKYISRFSKMSLLYLFKNLHMKILYRSLIFSLIWTSFSIPFIVTNWSTHEWQQRWQQLDPKKHIRKLYFLCYQIIVALYHYTNVCFGSDFRLKRIWRETLKKKYFYLLQIVGKTIANLNKY